jgi:hypothetical protein
VTLQTSTNLAFTNWTTIATNDPSTNLWIFTNTTSVTDLFYRAFITTP